MIEKWLQFTCDVCDEVRNSVASNMTLAEFMRDERIVRVGNDTVCRGKCARIARERRAARLRASGKG